MSLTCKLLAPEGEVIFREWNRHMHADVHDKRDPRNRRVLDLWVWPVLGSERRDGPHIKWVGPEWIRGDNDR